MNIRELPTPISFKPDPTIGKTTSDKADFLKVYLKTQPWDRDRK